jgi:hypothetical protein
MVREASQVIGPQEKALYMVLSYSLPNARSGTSSEVEDFAPGYSIAADRYFHRIHCCIHGLGEVTLLVVNGG